MGVSTLVQDARDVGLIPTLGAIFPSFKTPTILTLILFFFFPIDAPVVRITPSDVSGRHLVVVEGSNATLMCDVDSNPYTSSRKWEKDGVPTAGKGRSNDSDVLRNPNTVRKGTGVKWNVLISVDIYFVTFS